MITTTKPADLQGWQAETGLWELNQNKKLNQAVKQKPIPAAIRFLHTVPGYPPKLTWIAAINAGNLSHGPY